MKCIGVVQIRSLGVWPIKDTNEKAQHQSEGEARFEL